MAAIGGVLAAAILILSMPVDVEITYDNERTPHTVGSIAFAFGVIRKQLGGAEKKEKPRKARRQPNWLKLARSGFLSRLLRFAARLLRTAKIRRLSVNARVGLGDPAETGMMWGAVAAVSPFLPSQGHWRIRPDWGSTPVFNVDAEARFRIWPIRTLVVLIAFAVLPSTWRGIRAMRSTA